MNKDGSVMRACSLFLLWAAAGVTLPAQTFITLHNFAGPEGSAPNAVLVQGIDGNFYGTAFGGGSNGSGTIYKITPSGVLTTIYNFCSLSGCADGLNPQNQLILGADGAFYGTTDAGGTSTACSGGCGTVYRFKNGILTTLHSFELTDGETPQAGLVQGIDGNFYGTTQFGGPPTSSGTLYEITPTGDLTTLANFDDSGYLTYSSLILATDGNLYGTTHTGGVNGGGTVYKLGSSGLTTLYSFNGTVGYNPSAGLAEGTDGNFYGTTDLGGTTPFDGTIFKITPTGTYTTLHDFDLLDGSRPLTIPGMVLGTDGNFYGTTSFGGLAGLGTIFEITPSGTLTVLGIFRGPDGELPVTGLIQGTEGAFYGTTPQGGATGLGTVFKLSTGLGPFVQPVPTWAAAGSHIRILGTNLTGATSVTFNGLAASFTVVSGSEITTTVPEGATRGVVQVVTPAATLSSKLPFHVLP